MAKCHENRKERLKRQRRGEHRENRRWFLEFLAWADFCRHQLRGDVHEEHNGRIRETSDVAGRSGHNGYVGASDSPFPRLLSGSDDAGSMCVDHADSQMR